MAGDRHHTTGATTRLLTIEEMLLRACLLAGYGRQARDLAQRLASASQQTDGRSCLDAGAPLQLTVDAPGQPELRVGIRLGMDFNAELLSGLLAPEPLKHIAAMLKPLPASTHDSFGTWLFWSKDRQSVYIDLRDPNANDAMVRLQSILDTSQQRRLLEISPAANEARPWALRLDADSDGISRLHVHWLVHRNMRVADIVEKYAPGCWQQVVDTLGHLIVRPGISGRWVLTCPLDDNSRPGLRIGNSGWTLVPENHDKQRKISRIMSSLDGPRDYAEALWSLCRGTAGSRWRVGRACELRITEAGLRSRLFFTPHVQAGIKAGTRTSFVDDSSISDSTAAPLKEYLTTR